MIKYSIILVTYNWPQALKVILDNLLPQLLTHKDVELVIADDGSTSDTADIIKNFQTQIPDRCHHIWHEDLGFRRSEILNKAAATAKGEYLMFLDGDCIPFPDYVQQHKKLAEAGFLVAGNRVLLSQEFSKAATSNPVLISELVRFGFIGWLKAKLAHKVNKVLVFLRFNPNSKWRYARHSNWKYPKGSNIGVWAKDFISVNGYDENFVGWGHEDADLFIRLLHLGIKMKDGRFAIPVLHLWHKEANRENAKDNYNRLLERLNDNSFIKATSGVNNH